VLFKVDSYEIQGVATNTTFGFVDHDYGCDNSDSTYKYKYESGLAFVDFLDV